MRMLMMPAVGAALLSAFALYAVNQDTRQLAATNQATAAKIKAVKSDIAILRAERAFLMRPDRLEPYARKIGMRPIRGQQFVAKQELPRAKTERR